MQLHVDDVLGCGEKSYANEVIQPTLAGTYKLTWRTVEKTGDAVTFLKKKHCLISDTELLIAPHPKHFEKLFKLRRIDINGHSKHTPHLSKLDELDATEPLTSDQAKVFRCCMGILMHVASDVPRPVCSSVGEHQPRLALPLPEFKCDSSGNCYDCPWRWLARTGEGRRVRF